jgi:DNA polymerase elongation subunit (family B)
LVADLDAEAAVRNALSVIALDIETDTEPPRDGLDWRSTRVVSVACYAGPDARDQLVLVDRQEGGERRILDALGTWLSRRERDVVLSWNGTRFDLPMLASRVGESGSTLCVDRRARPSEGVTGAPDSYARLFEGTIEQHPHLDVGARLWRSWARAAWGNWRLKDVAARLGLDPVREDASAGHLLSDAEMAAYNLSDTRITHVLEQIWRATDGQPSRYEPGPGGYHRGEPTGR